ncbi:DNA double-strand break repair nuclease NurA [Shouchella shacheensis]|uniref:DNA double-strand break repair nuclease NurA n=1 Tax=Shouchella shacheensis TaxID=1649580 RepID=UPI00073FE745|nr:DNA double-strand break repair nuclease NurA [Shouchella shacheensis]
MDIKQELVEKLQRTNQVLQDKYRTTKTKKEVIREKLLQSSTVIRQNVRLSPQNLEKFLNGRKLAGTDGSVNQTKGEPPRVLYLFQALAKTTDGVESWETDLYVPLLENDEESEPPTKWRAHLLAKLELLCAIQLIEQEDVRLMIMDGALYHYRIDAPEEWERLRSLALQKDAWLVGVSEEITTENLVKLPLFNEYNELPSSYDRDMLFGVLERNEMVYIEDIQHKAGLKSVWMRLGSSPSITGFDMLEEQTEAMEAIGDILCTLTPKEGRGIPLWLDYIDSEIRLTDKLVEGLMDQYIDPEIKRQFFTKMREDRPY